MRRKAVDERLQLAGHSMAGLARIGYPLLSCSCTARPARWIVLMDRLLPPV
jgi:hypothetical protein